MLLQIYNDDKKDLPALVVNIFYFRNSDEVVIEAKDIKGNAYRINKKEKILKEIIDTKGPNGRPLIGPYQELYVSRIELMEDGKNLFVLDL